MYLLFDIYLIAPYKAQHLFPALYDTFSEEKKLNRGQYFQHARGCCDFLCMHLEIYFPTQ